MPDRDGFNYTIDRLNGQFLNAVQYSAKMTWTKGVDPKSGKLLDYDPGQGRADLRARLERAACRPRSRTPLPGRPWRHQFLAAMPIARSTKLLYIAGNEGCANITP